MSRDGFLISAESLDGGFIDYVQAHKLQNTVVGELGCRRIATSMDELIPRDIPPKASFSAKISPVPKMQDPVTSLTWLIITETKYRALPGITV